MSLDEPGHILRTMAETVKVPSSTRTCQSCRTSLSTEARFCGMCGAKLLQPGHFTADSLLETIVAQGAYRIEGLLGTGSMGVVYRAEQLALGRKVAFKVIGESADDETTRARFRREARAASQLGHPNVVQIYDFGQIEGGQPYLAMELLHGRSLEDVIAEDFPLDLARVGSVLKDTLSALQSAHNMGILHRDLKPANVFLSALPDGREVSKVLDFGVATAMDNTLTESKTWAPLTEAGFVCGTPAFMSPEQVQGFSLDQRSDLFSAGALLYIMLTKERPFAGKSPVEVGANIVLKPLVPPSRTRPDLSLPETFDSFLGVAMAKKPEDRFNSAAEMIQAFDACYGRVQRQSASAQAGSSKPIPEPTLEGSEFDSASDTVPDMPKIFISPMQDEVPTVIPEPEPASVSPLEQTTQWSPPVIPTLESRPNRETMETSIVSAAPRKKGTICVLLGSIITVLLIVFIVIKLFG